MAMNEQQIIDSDLGAKKKQRGLHPEWTKGDSLRAGQPPQGFKLRNLEFGAKNIQGSPTLEKIGLEELIGANAFENADLKANHTEPGVLTGMLAETMAKLEEKYHSGAYDAAAMPLVKKYLDEMQVMANIQLERFEIIAKRVSDVKEANEAAYSAVYTAREQRESEIRENCKFVQDELAVARYRRQRREALRQEARDNERLMKDLERLERLTAKQQHSRSQEEIRTAENDAKARESAMHIEQQESINRTRMAQEELHRVQALTEAKRLELAGAKAAVEAAELQLAKARTELAERSLREEQTFVLDDMRHSVCEARRLYEEEIQAAKAEIDEFLKETREFAPKEDAGVVFSQEKDASQAQMKSNRLRDFLQSKLFGGKESITQEQTQEQTGDAVAEQKADSLSESAEKDKEASNQQEGEAGETLDAVSVNDPIEDISGNDNELKHVFHENDLSESFDAELVEEGVEAEAIRESDETGQQDTEQSDWWN